MIQTRMPENFCFDDLIKNFMIKIKPEAKSHKNTRILEISKNFKFFCSKAELFETFTKIFFENCVNFNS